jgi:hypothetical protein
MANRSDYNSALPRSIKRMLSLQSSGDPHQDGVVRRAFIEAHDTARKVRSKRLAAKTNVNVEEETTETV